MKWLDIFRPAPNLVLKMMMLNKILRNHALVTFFLCALSSRFLALYVIDGQTGLQT